MYANLTTNPSVSPSLAFNTGAGRPGITRSHGDLGWRCHHRVRILITQGNRVRERARVIVITEREPGRYIFLVHLRCRLEIICTAGQEGRQPLENGREGWVGARIVCISHFLYKGSQTRKIASQHHNSLHSGTIYKLQWRKNIRKIENSHYGSWPLFVFRIEIMNGLGGRGEGGGENSVTSCCRGWEELNIENKTRDNDKWLEAGPCPTQGVPTVQWPRYSQRHRLWSLG